MNLTMSEVPEDGLMILTSPDGCSKAVARRATPTSAADGIDSDIARGMGHDTVNPQPATSAVGRGANPQMIGESTLTLIGNQQEIADAIKTSDGPGHSGHRG